MFGVRLTSGNTAPMDARRKSPARAPQARWRDRSALPCTATAWHARSPNTALGYHTVGFPRT